ncbi:MAG: ubiquitin-like domain-containing protein [Actinomycetota bacterium]
MAVRPTRVRRLRIHRAIQATTFAVSIAFVGATWFIAARTQVTLVVGGRAESISTNSENVRELLQVEGITLDGSDRVVPPLATVLADGMTVVVSPAPAAPGALSRSSSTLGLEDLAVNQVPTGVGVWTVEGASSGPAARIAAELAEASASAVDIGTSPVVSVRAVVAGKVHDVLTNARTTGELLSAMGITPGVHDRVRPSSSTPLHVGSTVVFDRVQILTRELRRSIPFVTRTFWTTSLPMGRIDVVSAGMAGLAFVTERVVVVNGRVESTTVTGERVVRPAVDRVRRSGAASPVNPQGLPGGHEASGEATWYDPPWSGLTAASPWIAFGTHVTVTDLATGRTVIVVIDDRGPFSPGRIIDLSPEAFSVLSPLGRGVLDVRISW